MVIVVSSKSNCILPREQSISLIAAPQRTSRCVVFESRLLQVRRQVFRKSKSYLSEGYCKYHTPRNKS